MKKIITAALITLCSTGVFAEGFKASATDNSAINSQQGFNEGVITVKQAKSLRDDTWVTLRGHITQQIGKEDYLFKDDTDSITVEIDHNKWNGLTVTPDDLVEIRGEIDKDLTSIEIEVKSIRKVN